MRNSPFSEVVRAPGRFRPRRPHWTNRSQERPRNPGHVCEQGPGRAMRWANSRSRKLRPFKGGGSLHILECADILSAQNCRRNANWISRGVPEPTGVMGDTMAVFKFIVLMMLPNPLGQPVGAKIERSHVACG